MLRFVFADLGDQGQSSSAQQQTPDASLTRSDSLATQPRWPHHTISQFRRPSPPSQHLQN